MEIMIRKAINADAEKLDELVNCLVKFESENDKNVKGNYKYKNLYKDILSNNKNIIFVAKKEKEICGYIYGFVAKDQAVYKEPVIFIDTLFVLERYRNNKIGQKLLKKLEKWSEEKGYKQIELGVTATNYAAISFYKKYGYTIKRYEMGKDI